MILIQTTANIVTNDKPLIKLKTLNHVTFYFILVTIQPNLAYRLNFYFL